MAHWVTPPVIMTGNKYTALGEVNYGSESRMFVFAFRDVNNNKQIIETSIPAYHNIVALTSDERASFIGSQYIIIDANTNIDSNTTEVPLMYTKQSVQIDTGLRLASNGQIVGKLRISDPVKELVFKVKYIDPPVYEVGVKYRAYTHVQSNGRLYQLKNNTPLPYYAESGTPDLAAWDDIGAYSPQLTPLLPYANNTNYTIGSRVSYNGRVYELSGVSGNSYLTTSDSPHTSYWKNLGAISGSFPTYTNNKVYDIGETVKYGSNVYELLYSLPYISSSTAPDMRFWTDVEAYNSTRANEEARIFRIIINTRQSALINFETDSDLGIIKIGQQLGDSRIMNIVATSAGAMSYELLPEHRNTVGVEYTKDDAGVYWKLPKGLALHADGTIVGHPVGPIGTYRFDVIARNTIGLEKQQTFQVQVYDGYLPNTVRASLRPRFDDERKWFKMIADSSFTQLKLYRPTDPNYGLRDYMEVELKRNIKGEYLSQPMQFNVLQSLIGDKLRDQSTINCRLGNMRYRTALDVNGAPLYEILYKEVLPLSMPVTYDTVASREQAGSVPEFKILKNRLTSLLGSDDDSIVEDALRHSAITIDNKVVYDDLALWATNPSKTYQAVEGYIAIMPVAYVMPGESEKFIKRAIEYGSLPTMMLNELIVLDSISIRNQLSETHHTIMVPLSNN